MAEISSNYNDRVRDRKIHARALAARQWLGSPLNRLLLPKARRIELETLMAHLVKQMSPTLRTGPDPLTRTPAIGTSVMLLREDPYLREHFGATPGSIGRVKDQSHLNPDDDGVLVRWGNQRPVRCDLVELAAVAR